MSAYHLFEIVAISGFLLYSLRQILPLFPSAAAHIARLARSAGVSPRLFLPARFNADNADGCSSCNGCSGCSAPGDKTAQVITLHRNNKKA